MNDYSDIIDVAPVSELKKYPVLTRVVTRGDPVMIALAQSEIASRRMDHRIREMQTTINKIKRRQNDLRLQRESREHQAGCERVWLSRIRRLSRARTNPQAAYLLGAVLDRVFYCWQCGRRFAARLNS